MDGLSQNGRKRIRQGCGLLEEHRACLTFWTITLPDEALIWLHQTDRWQQFQEAIRHRLTLRLRRLRGKALVVGVVEMHPQRSQEVGVWLPHLHICYRSKRHRWERWAISPQGHDRLILQALAACGLHLEDVPAASKIVPVHRSVSAYLSKYLSKPTRQPADNFDREPLQLPELTPRQWWLMSKELRDWIEENTVPVPAEWLAWLIDNRGQPKRGALYIAQQADIPDPRAPSVWLIHFRSPDALVICWEEFERAVIFGAHRFLSQRSPRVRLRSGKPA